MRFQLFKLVDGKKFLYRFLFGESKKRQYFVYFDKENKISDFRKFKKESGGYFLIYDNE